MNTRDLDGVHSLPQLRRLLNNQGVTRLAEVARALHDRKEVQTLEGLYSHDRFTIDGSHSNTEIVDGTFAPGSSPKIMWCVNHYTGLNRDPRVIRAAQEAVARYGTGSGTSAMSGGMCELHKKAERMICEMVGKEAAMLFPTGYSANLGAISALARPGDMVLFDREAHASIIDGIRLSGAKFQSFKHNSVDDLEKKLERWKGRFHNLFVVVESAYSMSGDLAPLPAICELKAEHEFYLYVDEAHTFGFYGDNGAGYCAECGATSQVDFLMSTLSKATAAVGGFLACDRVYIALLKWSANAYLFQACFPPADAAVVIASIDILRSDPGYQRKLH